MKIITSTIKCRTALQLARSSHQRIAFVPTMGNLHDGHLRLVQEAKQIADCVVVSIFVNPLQFGVGEDFERYPRTETEDQAKLKAAGVDVLFQPSVSDIITPNMHTVVSVKGLSDLHCGAFRPGHFDGVATIVCKLFNIVQPHTALFGLKDFQQLAIIRAMVNELNIPVQLIGIETVREDDGLAMSSRNDYLTGKERAIAPLLYQTLCTARTAVQNGAQNYHEIERQAVADLTQAGFQVDYFTICRYDNLQKAHADDHELVILTAARLGKTRLIDNLEVHR
jgi:pantoate--beta-alanine ligase